MNMMDRSLRTEDIDGARPHNQIRRMNYNYSQPNMYGSYVDGSNYVYPPRVQFAPKEQKKQNYMPQDRVPNTMRLNWRDL